MPVGAVGVFHRPVPVLFLGAGEAQTAEVFRAEQTRDVVQEIVVAGLNRGVGEGFPLGSVQAVLRQLAGQYPGFRAVSGDGHLHPAVFHRNLFGIGGQPLPVFGLGRRQGDLLLKLV